MSINSKKRYQDKRKTLVNAECMIHVGRATLLMSREFRNKDRQKLTHAWLAEALTIPRYKAFKVLWFMAQHKIYCKTLKDHRIFWLDEEQEEEKE